MTRTTRTLALLGGLAFLRLGGGRRRAAGLAALALRFRWTAGPISGLTAFLYTIPSVALFGILVPYFGLSRLTAVLPLAMYTLIILVTNIVAGYT